MIALRVLSAAALAFISAMGLPSASRAEWPERAVKFIVTFPPGSANDAAARLFGDALSKRWGKPVVVEDRAGAEGTLGVGSFVNSQDDHTLLYTVAGSITVAPLLIDKLSYDIDRDLKPVAATTSIVLTLAVNEGLGARDIPELIEVLKAGRGKYSWTSGPTLPRYVFAAFLKRRALEMNYLSYRDAAQPQADLGEGRIQLLVTSLAASSSPVQTGKARFLAVLNSSRAATLPDIKTARELGYPELEIDGLAGIFAGRAMPDALRDRIAADIAAVCADTDVRRKLEAGGHNVLNGSAEELKAGIAKQRIWVAEINRIIDLRDAK
jgi:tripartite-type tricarboxylate transporter receptor subunit TctC